MVRSVAEPVSPSSAYWKRKVACTPSLTPGLVQSCAQGSAVHFCTSFLQGNGQQHAPQDEEDSETAAAEWTISANVQAALVPTFVLAVIWFNVVAINP